RIDARRLRLRPRMHLNVHNHRRISVPFVIDGIYSFAHSMNSAPHPQPVANNLQPGARLALIGLIVNIAFAIIKIAGGLFGNAYALIADGLESALDVAGSIGIWGGLRSPAGAPEPMRPCC